MALRQPESMDELIYFTKRSIDKGRANCWVFREKCPKCGKGLMGKPIDDKTGKAKIRAKEYICPECSHTVPKQEYEETLMANIEYTCPACNHSGEMETPFKRKTYKGVKAVVFNCESCKEKIGITKKMKEAKGKKKSSLDED